MGEKVSMPMDAVLWVSLCLIVFLYSMLGDYFSADTATLFVYIIYSIGMVFSVLFGFFLIQMYDKEEEGDSPF
jgi:hypothetical protein